MSQRNPMNDRYTADTTKGKTRKSAAAAKPKSKAASSVRVQSKVKTKEQIKADRKAARRAAMEEEAKYRNPPTQEYKTWRIIFWVALGLAIVFTVLSWALQGVTSDLFCYISIGAAYVVLIFAFWIDFYKCRRLREAYRVECQMRKTKSVRRAVKQEKSKARAAAQRYQYEEVPLEPEPNSESEAAPAPAAEPKVKKARARKTKDAEDAPAVEVAPAIEAAPVAEAVAVAEVAAPEAAPEAAPAENADTSSEKKEA